MQGSTDPFRINRLKAEPLRIRLERRNQGQGPDGSVHLMEFESGYGIASTPQDHANVDTVCSSPGGFHEWRVRRCLPTDLEVHARTPTTAPSNDPQSVRHAREMLQRSRRVCKHPRHDLALVCREWPIFLHRAIAMLLSRDSRPRTTDYRLPTTDSRLPTPD